MILAASLAWYWILLIVLGAILVTTPILLFIIYKTNADLHLVEKIYNWLIKYQDKRKIKTKL